MTTLQLITSLTIPVVVIVFSIFAAGWLNQKALENQMSSFRNEVKAELMRVEDRLASMEKRFEDWFSRIESDIREIKTDLDKIFKPILPS